MFNILRHCQTVFQNICTSFHSKKQCIRVQVFLSSHQHLFEYDFLILVIPVYVKCYLIATLVFISLMASDVEPLFIYSFNAI